MSEEELEELLEELEELHEPIDYPEDWVTEEWLKWA